MFYHSQQKTKHNDKFCLIVVHREFSVTTEWCSKGDLKLESFSIMSVIIFIEQELAFL